MRRLLPVLLAAAIAAGCDVGGASEPEEPEGAAPAEWAAAVCGAVTDWRASLESKQEEALPAIGGAADLEEARSLIVEFLEEAVADTDRMLDRVEEAGPPAVEEGERLQEDVEDTLGQARDALEDARAAVANVPTDDAAAFQREAIAVGEELLERGEQVEQAFAGLGERFAAPELDEALERADACDALVG